jgi:hypothetical protein
VGGGGAAVPVGGPAGAWLQREGGSACAAAAVGLQRTAVWLFLDGVWLFLDGVLCLDAAPEPTAEGPMAEGPMAEGAMGGAAVGASALAVRSCEIATRSR